MSETADNELPPDWPHRLVNGVPVPLTPEQASNLPVGYPHRGINGKRIVLTEAEAAAHGLDLRGAPVAAPREVRKLLIVERLAAAGKLKEAIAALKLDASPATLTDDELVLRERWNAASTIFADDPVARGMLAKIGADPDAILAPE